MFFQRLIQRVKLYSVAVVRKLENRFKQWTRPGSQSLVVGTLVDVRRDQRDLIAENALRRPQLIILQRQTKRPVLTQADRGLMVLLARWVRHWRVALMIVKPETLSAGTGRASACTGAENHRRPHDNSVSHRQRSI